MSTPNRYATAGRLGAYTRWGNCTDRAAATEAARQAAADRFLRQVQAEYPELTEKAAVQMADARRKAWYTQISRKGVAARAARNRGGAA
jgi:hypothetical protein